MEKEMENFDWVKERAACSAQKMFERLKADIAEDVKKRTELIRPHPQFGTPYGFNVKESHDEIRITREGNRDYWKVITVSLANERIVAKNEAGASLLEATVTLNDKGMCLFKVKDEERQSWQFRKMILEDILFNV